MKLDSSPARCLILACGNTLRNDDGIGPNLAEWAEERFEQDSNIRVIARQQFTPDLAEEIAAAESVLFIDSSVELRPGRVDFFPVIPRTANGGTATHQFDAPDLLALARDLYDSRSAHAMLLTVGAGSMELGESFSDEVEAALPRARGVIEKAVFRLLEN
ncbi:MAG TPA: hydrogenase maturation protease [Terracidiphilus sp.]|nr:hydrogenase maturation protease [Terracidiphilus sp.]